MLETTFSTKNAGRNLKNLPRKDIFKEKLKLDENDELKIVKWYC
nr:MAG TPA: hypothetical protein [Caudoviricetes sp.]